MQNSNFIFRFFMVLTCLLTFLAGCMLSCSSKDQTNFVEEIDKKHSGDYLATYPLHSPDSCIARLKAEVPANYQAQECIGLWYRMSPINIDSAFRLLDLYERYYPHDTVSAFVQLKRAEFYVDAAQFEKADTCLNNVERICQRLKRASELADLYFVKGRMEMYRNNFGLSRQNFFTSLEWQKRIDTSSNYMLALTNMSIGITYERSEQQSKSREWLLKIWHRPLDSMAQEWLPKMKIQSAVGIAIGYLNTKPDSSLVWATRAKEIVEQSLKIPMPPRLLYALGRSHVELNQCAIGLPLLREAFEKRPPSTVAFGHHQFPLALGQAYLCLQKLDSADKMLHMALGSPDTGNLAKTYDLLGQLAVKRGDYKAAWQYKNISTELIRAKFTTDRIQADAETDARFETLEQSKKVVLLEKEQDAVQSQLVILVLVLLLISVGAVVMINYLRRRQLALLQESQKAKENVQAKESELEYSNQQHQLTKEELNQATALLKMKNELIEMLDLRIKKYKDSLGEQEISQEDFKTHLTSLRILTKDEWINFIETFSNKFPNFIQEVHDKHPSLSSAETRLMVLIKIGLNTKQICEMLGIADNSVWRSRHRLFKKLNLESATDLEDYINSL